MKRIISIAMVLSVMCAMLASCTGEKNNADNLSEQSNATNQIIVGTSTELDFNMMRGWTNISSNNDIRNLINQGEIISWTKEGSYEWNNTNVIEHSQKDNDDGSRTYTVTINSGMKWTDGVSITAKDYLFTNMFYSSPLLVEIQAQDVSNSRELVGYENYSSGVSESFSGMQLIDDYTFSLTVKAENIPYYYELSLIALYPTPMHIIAPDVTMLSDSEKGVQLTDNYTADLIKETVASTQSGYRYYPLVTYGAYRLESFNTSTKQATLVANPYFLGDYTGQTPQIDKIIIKSVSETTQMDELRTGTVDLIHSVTGGQSINAGLDVVDDGYAEYSSYDRAGYGKIAFSTDFGATQFVEVRQAIAHCLDRVEFAQQYSGGYAKVVHGYYGLSNQEYKDSLEFISDNLNHYEYDLQKAEQLLIDGGWTLNSNGDDYRTGIDKLRYKMVDGELIGLEINWANSIGNPVSDLLATMLPSNVEAIGGKINPTTVEFGILSNHLNRVDIDEPIYHMFNLATNFSPVHSYWYYLSDEDEHMGAYNQSYIRDEQLSNIAEKMKNIDSDDYELWLEQWQQLQLRWNTILPEIPLYSDEYHNFYNSKIKDFEPEGLWGWSYAILYSRVE